jgi:leader peptidase (prepilin peptidase)/N-methyltransferase
VWTIYAPIVAIIGMLFVAFLICATFIDLDHMIIPDRFSIGGMVIGVVLSLIFPSLHGIEGLPLVSNIQSGVTAIVGALVGAGLVYWIAVLGEIVFRKPAMGEGDVKFVGFIGAFCGWQGAVFSMFGGALVGTVVLLPALLIGRFFSGNKATKDKTHVENLPSVEDSEEEEVQFGALVPFGPMLAVAALIYFLGFHLYVDAYFANFVLHFLTP